MAWNSTICFMNKIMCFFKKLRLKHTEYKQSEESNRGRTAVFDVNSEMASSNLVVIICFAIIGKLHQ